MRAAVLACLLAAQALAHDGPHAAPSPRIVPPPAPAPFPVAIEARFDLIDHHGRRRTEADFRGRPLLLFFGYAGCDAICSVALPRMVEALDLLGPDADLAAAMITVDPRRDTPEALAAAMPAIHPRLIGLTGAAPALAAARAALQAEAKQVATAPDGAPVFAHASFVYLIGPDGRVATLLPPVLSPARMAEIVAAHVAAARGGDAPPPPG